MSTETIYKLETIVLPRWDVALHVAVEQDRKTQWFPLRALCRALGISWPSQSEVIKHTVRLEAATRILHLQTDAGMRPMMCMKRPELAFWLAGIDAQRVKEDFRDELEAFQVELMAAADQLLWGNATHVLPAHERGVLYHSARQELTFACEECGAFHRIVIENGEVIVTRK